MSENSAEMNLNSAPHRVLGIVAGDGPLPVALVQTAKAAGVKTVVLALSRDAYSALKPCADATFECAVGQLEKAVKLLNQEHATAVQFVGTVPAMNLVFNMHKLDTTAVNIVTRLPNLNQETLQQALGDFMVASGFAVLEQSTYLRKLFPQPAVLSKRIPSDSEYLDIAFGLAQAQQLADANSGSMAVVHRGKVIAQDSVNGTDQTIRLALRKQAGSLVVCKVARTDFDGRFYLPSVGLGTLKALSKDGRRGNVLAIRAGETVALELDAMIDYCDRHNLSFVVMEASASLSSDGAAALLSEVT